jgi:hypothetical protein
VKRASRKLRSKASARISTPTVSPGPGEVPASRPSHDAREWSPRALGPVLSGPQFWALMERWQVPDATALALIDYPGKLGAAGKRPRFRFTTKQRRITSYLAEIDAVLAAAGKGVVWLHRRISGPPFSRRSPIDHLVAEGMDGATDVLRLLNRMALRAALQT